MARTGDTADYMVTQCQTCGMLNVIPREYPDGRVCADCSGGPLVPMGYAILQERPMNRITVQADVERGHGKNGRTRGTSHWLMMWKSTRS